MPALKLKINGKDYSVEASPEMPLLWALRDLLGLTGTKFGCGMALCGASRSGPAILPKAACPSG